MTLSLGQPDRRAWLLPAKWAAGCALLYALADIALNRFAFSDGWTILWPLNGITIALLLMQPRFRWLPILVGVALGTGIGECLDGNAVTLELWLRVISVTEVVISASLLPAFSSLEVWLRTPKLFQRFVASLLLGPGISGVLAALVFQHLEGRPYLTGFNNWATADALGIAATMPVALAVRSPLLRGLFTRRNLLKTLAILALALAAAAAALAVSRYPLLFLVYPVLLLVDLQLAFAGSALAMFLVCLLAVYLATNHHGPFGLWPANLFLSRDLALQLFLGFQVVALFPASIRLLERRRFAEDLHQANVQLTRLASLDGLTGIPNRRSFDERFASEWSRASRAGSPLAMLMVDIDKFKEFNDRYGHHAGDQALIAVAGVLASWMRRPGDLAARFGGEEFAVLLPHTGQSGAAQLAEQLRQATAALNIPHQGSPFGYVTVSIGCAVFTPAPPAPGEDRLQLLTAADQALYQAKKAGRNCVEVAGGDRCA